MDLAAFKAQIEKSREAEVTIRGIKFLLRLPSEHAWRLVTEEASDESGKVMAAKAYRNLLMSSIKGWEELKADDVLKGSGDEAVPFSHDALVMLLEERQDLSDELAKAVMRKVGERKAHQESARKNFLRASSGT